MRLNGKKVAILVEREYQDLEVWVPLYRLREEGAETTLVGTGSAREYPGKYGVPAKVDADAEKVSAASFHGLVIPGGWAPDRLRQYPAVNRLVREMVDGGKVVASICHGGSVLVSAGVCKGREMTSYAAIRDDLVAAGAKWKDAEVVRDGKLVTSRKPDDLPAFCAALVTALAES
jgi:protease I